MGEKGYQLSDYVQDYTIADMLCLELEEMQKLFEDALKRNKELKDGKYLVKTYKKLSKKEIIKLQEELKQSKQRKEAIMNATKKNDNEELVKVLGKEINENPMQAVRREQFKYIKIGRELMIQKGINIKEIKNLDEKIEQAITKIAKYREEGNFAKAVESCQNELIVLENKILKLIKQQEDELIKVEEKQALDTESEIDELEKQLKQSAERMKEYKMTGFSEQEAEEHKKYNEITKKINDYKNNDKEEKENNTKMTLKKEEKKVLDAESEIDELEKQLKQSAERMKEYKMAGFSEQEAEEHKKYNEIIQKINDYKNNDKEEKTKIRLKTELNNKSSIIDFEKTYSKTFTSHIGNIEYNINKLAHIKLLKSKKESNRLQKILNVPLTILKIPVKLLAKIPNSIMKTDQKIFEITENVNNLNADEFKILIKNVKELNKNNAYLDVVKTRLEKERNETVNLDKSISDRLEELEKIGEKNWTQEQKNEYFSKLHEYIDIYPNKIEEYKKALKNFKKKNIREEVKVHEKDNGNNQMQSNKQEINTNSLRKTDREI